jgi:hypothetical protein
MLESKAFHDRKGLELWLQDQPHKSCAEIAARAALRVLPLVLHSRPEREMLYTFRAAFIAWAANLYPDNTSDRLIIQAAFASTAGVPFKDLAARSAAAAAGTIAANLAFDPTPATAAFHNAGAAGLAAAAAAHAAAAAAHTPDVSSAHASAVGNAADTIWASINEDIGFLAVSEPGQLMQRELWPMDVRGSSEFQANFPRWARVPFDAFDKSPLVTRGPWGVWLAWYRAILPAEWSSRFGHAVDLQIAAQDSSFWQRDPGLVVAEIAEMAKWPWNSGRTSSHATSPDAPNTKTPSKKAAASPKRKSASRTSSAAVVEPIAVEAEIPPEPPPQPPSVSVEPQSDEPTPVDQLGRRPFAQALVERMDKIYQKGGHDGFAAHIYAPWGAGKTSVLMMMSELMSRADRKTADGKLAPHWVVVQFNAWVQERRNPPWWPLMEELKTECLKHLSKEKVGWLRMLKAGGRELRRIWPRARAGDPDYAALLRIHWIWWKVRTDAFAYIVAFFVTTLCIWILLHSEATNFDLAMKLFTAALLAFASFLAAGRVAFFGSASAAKLYEDISRDPLQRIKDFFRKTVETTGQPICIFIDDLDRCNADYVVDLLEGIQTSFRHCNVAYVVAADRNWIRSSFELRYSMFSSAVGSLGQPLGYLFLEKVFQVSTPVPGMGDKTRSAYWNRLLGKISPAGQSEGIASGPAPGSTGTAQFDSVVAAKRADLRERHGENLTGEQAKSIMQEASSAEDIAAVVLEFNTSGAAEKEAEHLLARFTGVLPENPRVMKRMINAFAMRQAIGLLEGSPVPAEVLARWTILEQRFPALADILIANPEWTQMLSDTVDDEGRKKLPPLLLPFCESEIIRNIVGTVDAQRLTVEHVRTITRGSVT